MKTKSFLIISFLIFLFSDRSNAQVTNYDWVRNSGGVGGADGNAVATDSYGNSYVTGYFQCNPRT